MITARATNDENDTGRFKLLADWGHDPEPRASTFSDIPYGLVNLEGTARHCACCDSWQVIGTGCCFECGAPWEREAA